MVILRERRLKKVHKEQQKIITELINPKVLQAYYFLFGCKYKKGEKLDLRIVQDYEIELMTYSEGGMYIDGKYYEVSKGDIAFRRPGQITQAVMPYNCYLICLDLGNPLRDEIDYLAANNKAKQKVSTQENYSNPIIDVIPPVFQSEQFEKYKKYFDIILDEFINRKPTSPLTMKAAALEILSNIYSDITNPLNIKLSSPHGKVIKETIKYIEKNINQKIKLDELAEIAELSPNYYHKIFTEIMDITPNDYIIEVKLCKAKELLIKTNKKIYEIGDECGYDNVAYFNSIFKKHNDITPLEYRRQHNYI